MARANDREETHRILTLYRKGHISEELVVEQLERLGSENGTGLDPSVQATVEMLDGYRAAEASGAETLLAWAKMTDDAALEGGLRTVAAREASHARLLEQRIRELGGLPRAGVPEWLERYNRTIVDRDATDLDRLATVVSQFPDPQAATAGVRRMAEAIAGDELSRELLLSICADEVASLEWVQAAYRARKAGG